MTDPRQLALVHAEIDGELDVEQRGELARCLLADRDFRARREDLRRLCEALDQLEDVEPPGQLREDILAALPQSSTASWSSAPRWRFAAVIAGILVAGVVMFEIGRGPRSAATDAAGTIAAPRTFTVVNTATLGGGQVSGRVSLYRDRTEFGLELDLAASAPVDVVIRSGGHSQRVNALGRQGKPDGAPVRVPLAGFGLDGGQSVDVIFLMAGRQVGSAALRVPTGP